MKNADCDTSALNLPGIICSPHSAANAQTISPECAPVQEQLKAAESAAVQNDWDRRASRYKDAVQIGSCVFGSAC